MGNYFSGIKTFPENISEPVKENAAQQVTASTNVEVETKQTLSVISEEAIEEIKDISENIVENVIEESEKIVENVMENVVEKAEEIAAETKDIVTDVTATIEDATKTATDVETLIDTVKESKPTQLQLPTKKQKKNKHKSH